MEPPPTTLETLERAIGYTFISRLWLDQALIHPSARHELNLAADNQRMEYLGDAVLGLAAAEYGYHQHAELDEGKLTMLRSAATSTTTLAEMARAIDLGRHLVLGRGEESSGGRDKDSNLADAMESVIGACYLDGGLDAVHDVFECLFTPYLERLDLAQPDDNPKGRLQEWAQRQGWACPMYRVIGEEGPSHQRRFTVEARLGELSPVTGSGNSKRVAETNAARALLVALPASTEKPASSH